MNPLGCGLPPSCFKFGAGWNGLGRGHKQISSTTGPQQILVLREVLTKATGALALVIVSPLIAFIWIGLRLERPGSAIALRRVKPGNVKAYSFVLGPGRISQFVRRGGLQTLPSLLHLVKGDNVLMPSAKRSVKISRPHRTASQRKRRAIITSSTMRPDNGRSLTRRR